MPTYDYRCSACGILREVKQRMTDEPLTQCPECGGPFKRVITSVGIIFKGGGFHVNDYRGSKSSSDSSSSSDESKKKDAVDKPETKTADQPKEPSSDKAQDKVA